jgi:hypothetical protein
MPKILNGHNSPETAYIVSDYPYGFKLRCKIRYWIETTKYGQRFVSQTTNPKKIGEPWNAPKCGTYSPIVIMFLDEQDHVEKAHLSPYETSKVVEFIEKYGEDSVADPYRQHIVSLILAAKARHEAPRGD